MEPPAHEAGGQAKAQVGSALLLPGFLRSFRFIRTISLISAQSAKYGLVSRPVSISIGA